MSFCQVRACKEQAVDTDGFCHPCWSALPKATKQLVNSMQGADRERLCTKLHALVSVARKTMTPAEARAILNVEGEARAADTMMALMGLMLTGVAARG